VEKDEFILRFMLWKPEIPASTHMHFIKYEVDGMIMTGVIDEIIGVQCSEDQESFTNKNFSSVCIRFFSSCYTCAGFHRFLENIETFIFLFS